VDRRSLCESTRNVSDTCLEKLKTNKGIIMISLIPALTHQDPAKAEIAHVVDHIEYVGQKIGYDHVGIGTDFDGMATSVNDLEDVSKFPNLVAAMVSRGISRTDVEKVIGLNIIRVLNAVETVSMEKSKSLPVMEDSVKQLWSNDIRSYVRQLYPEAE
jgi:membrane dipeptidase